MELAHNAISCRWAIQTLFLRSPLWLQAWDCPWSCLRDSEPRPLETTEECVSCARWQPHGLTPTPEPLRGVSAR